MLRNFTALPECSVRVLCDRDTDTLDMHRRSTTDARLTPALSTVIEDPDIDAVVLATPEETHASLSCLALRANKNVFVEKPMALSLEAAIGVRRAVEETGARLMVGHILCYHPSVLMLAELIGAGELGSILGAVTDRVSLASANPRTSAWWSLAPHDVSVIRSLFRADPLRVGATLEQTGRQPHLTSITGRLAFADGRIAIVRAALSASGQKIRRLVVFGTDKTAVFDDLQTTHKLRLYPTRPTEVSDALAGRTFPADWSPPADSATVRVAPEEPLRAETRHFVESLRLDRPFHTDADHGVEVTRVLQAGADSLEHGAPVALASLPL